MHVLTFSIKSAEEKYSHEVIAHAESMKAIDSLKKGLGVAQAAAREQLTASNTAQAKLSSSESSWRHQKDALEKEVEDLKSRYASYHTLSLPSG